MAFSYVVLFVLLGITTTAVAGWRIRTRRRRHQSAYHDEKKRFEVDDNSEHVSQTAPMIEPLPDFDWQNEEPLRLRPFKPTYHITMALQTVTPSSLILLDKNYLRHITARQKTIALHPQVVLGSIPSSAQPLQELYTYLLGTYLPSRYPGLFTLSPQPLYPTTGLLSGAKYFNNTISQKSFPLSPIPRASEEEMLRAIGETIEDDIFLLTESELGHVCTAFICCHPSGFDPSTKLGKTLAEIHGPVPSYREKIGRSMERFFGRLESGKRVGRVNWGIQTHSNLYAPSGNHVHANEEYTELLPHEVEISETRLRVELQSLMRLPETKALVFSFKTFLYPLEDIKKEEEGTGEQLAEAIEGLSKGNAPGMGVYKGGVKWGRVVTDYLRS
ncbi:hypothetical protein QBC44DRAFT_375826 [Cladorrhinum sp. PSN332]|nr:hypothetical protein QBC44DRAFT_375826 [Cladorrhinum sp. PSN332]